eukprot:TRINITY_DN92587_c0_g1_i1.p1 TRINITY_DN92587_c0_g1~~TRINITY_DN92587_c0_g1_i1.p1  ORF type:complete len:521 (+),score=67.59 TRINITY_DN92587_c0_g1_i1:44-1606(+)
MGQNLPLLPANTCAEAETRPPPENLSVPPTDTDDEAEMQPPPKNLPLPPTDTDDEWEVSLPRPALRFKLGQRVMLSCTLIRWSTGADGNTKSEYTPATIVDCWVPDPDTGEIDAYHAVLDNGRKIYVPTSCMDFDSEIREVNHSLLHQAVHNKQLDDLNNIINRAKAEGHASRTLDQVSEDQGQTALHVATSCGWKEGVQALLNARASVDMSDNLLRTPLLVAAKRGEHHLVEQFLEKNADVNAAEINPDHDPDFICTSHEMNGEHKTALHYAAELSNVPLTRVLLKGRANPNAIETKFQTPLHLAIDALRHDADCTFDLGDGISVFSLQCYPDLNGSFGTIAGAPVQSDNGAMCLPVCVEGSASDVMLLEPQNLRRSTGDVIELLVQAKADLNRGNLVLGESFTALHQVARTGNVTVTHKLLAARADVNRRETKVGFSPLHVAAKAAHPEIIQMLVDANADTALTINSGKTAADLAAVNGASKETIMLLGGSSGEAQPVASSVGYTALTPEQRRALFLE